MLAAIEEIYATTNLHIDFSNKDESKQLKRMFVSDVQQGMLERKDYFILDMVFPLWMHIWIDALERQKDLCWLLWIHCTEISWT